MCVPLAIGAAVAAGVTGAAGSIMQGMQGRAQGNMEAQVARRNEEMAVEGYRESRIAGQDERRDFWRKVGGIKGQQIASMAANGIEVDFGTAERIQDDTEMLARDDATNLYRNIENRSKGYLIEASNHEAEAKAAKARGKAAMTQGIFGAATSILGAASQVAGIKAKAK